VGRVADLADHFEAAHFGHLEIQQNQVRVLAGDALQRRYAVVRLAHHVNAAHGFQLLAQHFARDRLVVHDESL